MRAYSKMIWSGAAMVVALVGGALPAIAGQSSTPGVYIAQLTCNGSGCLSLNGAMSTRYSSDTIQFVQVGNTSGGYQVTAKSYWTTTCTECRTDFSCTVPYSWTSSTNATEKQMYNDVRQFMLAGGSPAHRVQATRFNYTGASANCTSFGAYLDSRVQY